MEDEKETIYVPVSNSDSALRPCLTEENAWKLIEKIPEISTPWTENEKMREQKYKEAIKANDPEGVGCDHKDDLPAEAAATRAGKEMHSDGYEIFPDRGKALV